MKKTTLVLLTFAACFISYKASAQTSSVTEIAFVNAGGGDDSDPYRMRKVQSSSNNNWLELQLNDDSDESFRIYGNSCVGYGCGAYSGNLYHLFDASGNVYHSGKVGIGTSTPGDYTKLNVVGGGIEISGSPHQLDASLHITTSYGQYGRLTQIGPSVANSPALNLMTSLDVNGNGNWWSWGVLTSGIWAFQPSTSFGGTTGMFIDRGGNLGVGTVAPAYKLDVNGTLNATDIRINGAALVGGAWTASGSNVSFTTGNVGIGTNSPNQKLTVNGTIYGKEVKVDLSVPGPDYVFDESYALPSLEEVKIFIDENKHLPEVPSAKEMEKNGINLSEMNMMLLKKVEEMTLYIIELKKESEKVKERMRIMEAEILQLKK